MVVGTVDPKEQSPAPTPRKACWHSLACVGVGVLLLCCGALVGLLWTRLMDNIMAPILRLSKDSRTYESWLEPQVPNYIEFYFFNWTNPEEILVKGKKLRFQEIGPYRFMEKIHKQDVVWNDNNTVTYRQVRYWHFSPEGTHGSMDDQLTTINIVSMSAAYIGQNFDGIKTFLLNQMMKTRSIAVTHSVSEMLFEGYDDLLLKFAEKTGKHAGFDKYGLFYKRNGSLDSDGFFNVDTGYEDLKRVAEVRRWNHDNKTEFFPDTCGRVRGTTGERFGPNLREGNPIRIFSNSLCRSVELQYDGTTDVQDILAYQYRGGSELFDNGTMDPRNACYCGDHCLPAGVLNISLCHHGAPVFTSFPHFFQADPSYLQPMEGLHPDPDKHSFYVAVEPTTGFPIDVSARLQINILVQPYPKITPFSQLPRVFFPIMWFQQQATITPDLAAPLRLLLMVPPFGIMVAVVCVVIGTAMLATVVLWQLRARHRRESKPAMPDMMLEPR